jgi:hypothetical protein
VCYGIIPAALNCEEKGVSVFQTKLLARIAGSSFCILSRLATLFILYLQPWAIQKREQLTGETRHRQIFRLQSFMQFRKEKQYLRKFSWRTFLIA